jgi:hypothetical protein
MFFSTIRAIIRENFDQHYVSPQWQIDMPWLRCSLGRFLRVRFYSRNKTMLLKGIWHIWKGFAISHDQIINEVHYYHFSIAYFPQLQLFRGSSGVKLKITIAKLAVVASKVGCSGVSPTLPKNTKRLINL